MYTEDMDRSRAARPTDERAERRMAAPAHEYARRIDCAESERRGGERGGRGYGAPGAGVRGGARRPD